MRKIGILGGTFDPIHYGHLAAAEEARAKLQLQKIIFVVAGVPPHKLNEEMTPAEDRLAMVQLAIASNPYFAISRVDMDRPGPSYSVDMVDMIGREEKGAEMYFVMGMDSLLELPTWHQPERLIRLCKLVAVERPGYRPKVTKLESVLPGISERLTIIDMPEMEISSTDIQRRVREGLPIKYQVPPEVEDYILDRGLYRAKGG